MGGGQLLPSFPPSSWGERRRFLIWASNSSACSATRHWLQTCHSIVAVSILSFPYHAFFELIPLPLVLPLRSRLEVASRPLLRTFVQAVFAYTAAILAQDTATLAGPNAPSSLGSLGPEYRRPYVAEQLERLKGARTLLLAMEVAACLPDEQLVQEGALRAHNMLAPLLALVRPPPAVHKALAKLHLGLQGVANLVQSSMVGQEANRATSARTAASCVYYLVRLSTEAGEGAAAAYFGKLQMELLKAYDPKYGVPGRLETTTLTSGGGDVGGGGGGGGAGGSFPGEEGPGRLQVEAALMQEALLSHPKLPEFVPSTEEGVAPRMKDEGDIVARCLPLISGPQPLEAWTQVLAREEALADPR